MRHVPGLKATLSPSDGERDRDEGSLEILQTGLNVVVAPSCARLEARGFLQLAPGGPRSYFRGMKRITLFLLGAVCLGFPGSAQDNAARAAAEREAAEERYKLLNSAVEGLTSAQADLQRRLGSLAEEVRSLRAQEYKIDTSKFVTREEFNRLVKAFEEIERKREDDKKLIREEFEQLKKDIAKLLNAPAPSATQKKNKAQPPAEKGSEKLVEKPPSKPDKSDNSAASALQEGVSYTIEKGNTLLAIVTAHNEKFKNQGKKTSVKLVLEANPGLDEKKLRIGQSIFIPLLPE